MSLVKHGLDWCIYALDQMRADGTWLPSTERWIEETDAAREELSALRKRCEDAEAILRAQYAGRFRAWSTFDGGWAWSHGGPKPDGFMSDDGTGLPVLTDEARKALGGGQ